MNRVAFKMQLLPGFEDEYQQRHTNLWPRLTQVLKEAGVHDYSIFFDPQTNALFAVLTTADPVLLDALPQHPVVKEWWQFMSDIMETNSDHSPVQLPLKELFYLP